MSDAEQIEVKPEAEACKRFTEVFCIVTLEKLAIPAVAGSGLVEAVRPPETGVLQALSENAAKVTAVAVETVFPFAS